MENLKVAYDGTVRDASDRILQFNYGDDGFDGVHIVRLKVPPLQDEWDLQNRDVAEAVLLRKERVQCVEADSYLRLWSKEHGETLVSCPVDVESLYEKARMMSGNQFKPASVNWLWNRVQELLSKVDVHLFSQFLTLFLQTKNLLKVSTTFAEWFLDVIEESYCKAKVHPGEMVGVSFCVVFSILY